MTNTKNTLITLITLTLGLLIGVLLIRGLAVTFGPNAPANVGLGLLVAFVVIRIAVAVHKDRKAKS